MKANKYLYIITAFLMLLTWLWVGIKKDDEFGELSPFLKYKPSLKVYFKSPLGMQDMPTDYPDNLRKQEALYDDFVNSRHPTDLGVFIYLAELLVLMTIVSLGIATYRLIKSSSR